MVDLDYILAIKLDKGLTGWQSPFPCHSVVGDPFFRNKGLLNIGEKAPFLVSYYASYLAISGVHLLQWQLLTLIAWTSGGFVITTATIRRASRGTFEGLPWFRGQVHLQQGAVVEWLAAFRVAADTRV